MRKINESIYKLVMVTEAKEPPVKIHSVEKGKKNLWKENKIIRLYIIDKNENKVKMT